MIQKNLITLKKNKFKSDKNCNIEYSNSNIKILNNYLKDNFVFYEIFQI